MKLELKLLATTWFSEVFIVNLSIFLCKLLFKKVFIEDWLKGFLNLKLLSECDGSFCSLSALF